MFVCLLFQCHNTIDAAIKSVPSDGVIIVHGGIYEECLEINKPVAIVGAGTYRFDNAMHCTIKE